MGDENPSQHNDEEIPFAVVKRCSKITGGEDTLMLSEIPSWRGNTDVRSASLVIVSLRPVYR